MQRATARKRRGNPKCSLQRREHGGSRTRAAGISVVLEVSEDFLVAPALPW